LPLENFAVVFLCLVVFLRKSFRKQRSNSDKEDPANHQMEKL
jgi:hypothetical protein